MVKPVVLALVASLCLSATASAERKKRRSRREPPPPPAEVITPAEDPQAAARARALALLAEGNAKLDGGAYVEALASFQAAYEAYPSPKLHFNIAQTYNELDRPIDALRHYELFVRDVPQADMPEQWNIASERMFQLQGKVATVIVQNSVVGAVVTIDGNPVGTTPLPEPVRVLPGPHVVVVNKPGFEQRVIEVQLDAGAMETTRVTLLTEAQAMAQRQEFQQAEAERRIAQEKLKRAQDDARSRRQRTRRIVRTAGWTALGVGIASTVAAGTFGGLMWRETSQLADAPQDTPWQGDGQDHYDRADQYRTMFYAAAAVGLVGVATGGGLLLFGPDADGEGQAERPRAALVPTVGPDEGGLVVMGSF